MTRLFTDGAEWGDTLFFNTLSAVTVSTAQKRSGNYSYLLVNASTYGGKNLATALSEFYLRFGLMVTICSTERTLFEIRAGTTVLMALAYEPTTARLKAYVGPSTLVATSSGSLALSTWGLVEIH